MLGKISTAIALVTLGSLWGCTQTGGDTTTEQERPRVALVMKSLANEFFKTMEQGARDYHAAHEADFELIVNGIKNEEDIAGQVSLVETMIARQVDALVIAPADSKAMIAVLAKALDAGIVVVNIDNKLDAEVLAQRGIAIPFVGPDNRAGARMAAEHLAKDLKPAAEVALITGMPSAFNGIQRRLGFEDAMKAADAKIVASQAANWEMAKANQVASGIISEHPNLKALLCANDSMALGAVAALEQAGKTGAVQVVGYDGISAVEDLIRAGRILCSVEQYADQLAVFGIEYALGIIESGATPEDRQTPVDLITTESLK